MMFTAETLAFFEALVGLVNLNGKDPNFEVVANQVIQAKKELAAAFAAIESLEISAAELTAKDAVAPDLEDVIAANGRSK